MKYQVKIRKDGSLEFLGAPPPGLKLPAETRIRFSEIIPVNKWARLTFRALRLFGENGWLAQWTRTWECQWECIILRGVRRGARRTAHGSAGRTALVHWEHQVWFGDWDGQDQSHIAEHRRSA